ncbi:MAG: methylmalonyl Co-A mutase-associated GTPase MeaB [Flavobacteriia bacterium]|nr:MAG: methylmalonyl Co-A mutase-associated GTPase MeaB [Flavobacteriia bacterium]
MPSLSKAITLVESEHEKHRTQAEKLINQCLPLSGNSIRIGITGVPGAGKSTFIESFGGLLAAEGKKVAILAVDPSSSQSKGSILGDKTRMERLVQNSNVFIRPSASGSHLGGVAKKTRESIVLCEAAGYDVILIETIGVGQSETTVHSMVDFFLLLQIVGAGDELQGMKRGIMELCDAILINKADGDNIQRAKLARQEYINALHLFSEKPNGWIPKVLTCSALEHIGIDKVWEMIQSYVSYTKDNDTFIAKREQQEEFWLFDTLNQAVLNKFYTHKNVKKELNNQLELLKQKKATPYDAASTILKFFD